MYITIVTTTNIAFQIIFEPVYNDQDEAYTTTHYWGASEPGSGGTGDV